MIANTDPIFRDAWAESQGFQWRKIAWNADDIQLLKGMVDRGHEIASHTVNHLFPTIQTLECAGDEARESKRKIEEWMGGVVAPSFAYPFYRVPERLKNAVIDASYRQARGGPQHSCYIGSVDWFTIGCHQISNNENVAGWVRPDCWSVMTFHGVGTNQDGWEPISVVEFARQMAELAKLRDSGAVEVATFKDGADRLRQASLR